MFDFCHSPHNDIKFAFFLLCCIDYTVNLVNTALKLVDSGGSGQL